MQCFILHSTCSAMFRYLDHPTKIRRMELSTFSFPQESLKDTFDKKRKSCPLFFFLVCVNFSYCQLNLFSSSQRLCSSKFTVFPKDFLSRQSVSALLSWWLCSWWRALLQVFALSIKTLLWRFPCDKEDTVVNVSQHRAVILCVGGLHWLFFHLQHKN